MKYSSSKEIEKEVQLRVRQGWQYVRKSKHGRLVSPTGGFVTVPCTPSDRRALRNFRRDVERVLNEETTRHAG
jgi:predicted RNA binding protein YcfA (HicA-like mRNA interferase family)